MESLDEILRRLGSTPTDARTAGTSDAPDPDEPDCPVCAGRRWIAVDAAPGAPGFGSVEPCQCQESVWGADASVLLQRYSRLGPLERLNFDNLNENGRPGFSDPESFRSAADAAVGFAGNPAGWLVLLGPSGCGKTHLAAAIANRIIESERAALYVSVPELLDHLRSTYGGDSEVTEDVLIGQIVSAPTLILDDLGIGGATAWAAERLDQILTRRYNARMPTVVTSSAPEESLNDRQRTRLLDPDLSTVRRILRDSAADGSAASGIERTMLESMTFDSFKPAGRSSSVSERESLRTALTACRSFAEQPDGWLLLAGPTGTGKTHLAVAIAGEQLARGRPVMFAFVPDLLDHLRLAYGPDSRISYDRLFDRVRRAELLVLDDMGGESATPWAEEKLYQLVVHRHNARLPTVITTRLLLDGEPGDDGQGARPQRGRRQTTFNEAIGSRLKDQRVVTLVPLLAPDYRDEAAGGERRGRRHR